MEGYFGEVLKEAVKSEDAIPEEQQGLVRQLVGEDFVEQIDRLTKEENKDILVMFVTRTC